MLEVASISAGYAKFTARKLSSLWIGENRHERYFKPHVYAAIQKELDKRAKRCEVAADNVLKEIAKIAFAKIIDFYNDDGTLKDISEIPQDSLAAVGSFEVVQTVEKAVLKKIKMIDKKGALELLGRHLGMFNDKLGIGGIGKDGEIKAININFVRPPKRDEEESPEPLPLQSVSV